jgi:hypothetical protein
VTQGRDGRGEIDEHVEIVQRRLQVRANRDAKTPRPGQLAGVRSQQTAVGLLGGD